MTAQTTPPVELPSKIQPTMKKIRFSGKPGLLLSLSAIALVGLQSTGHAELIAGVDFESGAGGFSSAPDDLNVLDLEPVKK